MKSSYKTKGYRPSKRGKTLVGKNGRITNNSKKNVEQYKAQIDARTDLSDREKRSLKADVDAYVSQAHREGKKLTTNGLEARYKNDSVNRLLTNAGYTPEEFAEEAGVDVDTVMNPDSWSNGLFLGMYEINFQYAGSILRKVS